MEGTVVGAVWKEWRGWSSRACKDNCRGTWYGELTHSSTWHVADNTWYWSVVPRTLAEPIGWK